MQKVLKTASKYAEYGYLFTRIQVKSLVKNSVAKLTKKVTSDPSDPPSPFNEDSDSSNEGFASDFEDETGWDADDEVEEANAADDMIKVIEGD